jgi:lipoprotein-releasing system ATP-binding protein
MNDTARVAALTLESVERRYGRGETTVEVLNGASLELSAGQSVALIAPSGAGKSTLLHLAGLLERPDAGEVKIAGAATSNMSDDRRTALRRTEIGFVYQFRQAPTPEHISTARAKPPWAEKSRTVDSGSRAW